MRGFPYVGPRFYQTVFETVLEIGGVLPTCVNPTISDCDSLESSRKTGFDHSIGYECPFG